MLMCHSLPDQGKFLVQSHDCHVIVLSMSCYRNCIGQEFALNEERVVLANILRHFELSLDQNKPVEKDYQLILRPKGGLYLKLKQRVH